MMKMVINMELGMYLRMMAGANVITLFLYLGSVFG